MQGLATRLCMQLRAVTWQYHYRKSHIPRGRLNLTRAPQQYFTWKDSRQELLRIKPWGHFTQVSRAKKAGFCEVPDGFIIIQSGNIDREMQKTKLCLRLQRHPPSSYLRDPHRGIRPSPVRQPVARSARSHTAKVRLVASLSARLQLRSHARALGGQEPGRRAPFVVPGQHQRSDGIQLVVAQPIRGRGRRDSGQGRGEGGDGLRVEQVVVCHLHVSRALAGSAGGWVVVYGVLEIAGLVCDEREEGGDFGRGGYGVA